MKENQTSTIGFFQKYLSVWVVFCMIIGVFIGHFSRIIPNYLNKFEYVGISIPMAMLIWIMIYPMMKVDFKSIKYIGKNPKGLLVTWTVNWIIKPFTMYGIASIFFLVIFKSIIPTEFATEYLAGAVLQWYLCGVL